MKESNWLKVYVIDVLPILLLSVYLLGIVYLESFFTFFGIDIFSYIGLETSLTVIIEPLMIFIFISLPFVMTLQFKNDNQDRKEESYIGKMLKEKNKWARKYSEWLDREQKKEDEKPRWRKFTSALTKDIAFSFFLIIVLYYINNCKLHFDDALLLVLFVYGIMIFLTWVRGVFMKDSYASHLFGAFSHKGIENIVLPYRVYVFMFIGSAFLGQLNAELRLAKKYDFTIYTNTNDTLNQENYYHIEHIGNVDFLMDKTDASILVVNNENIVKKSIKKDNFMRPILLKR